MASPARERIADLAYESMKQCIVCTEEQPDCRPVCGELTQDLGIIMRDMISMWAPDPLKSMELARAGARLCTEVCTPEVASCNKCVESCNRLRRELSRAIHQGI